MTQLKKILVHALNDFSSFYFFNSFFNITVNCFFTIATHQQEVDTRAEILDLLTVRSFHDLKFDLISVIFLINELLILISFSSKLAFLN